jgi:ribonuclease M5
MCGVKLGEKIFGAGGVMPKILLNQAILVEGKYDAIRLDSLFDALILPLDGFQIYHNEEQKQFLKRLAAQRGVVIATDSDAAGFQIRGYLQGLLPAERVWHVLIPDIFGKERRKAAPSREGKLGVEGMQTAALLEAFSRANIPAGECGAPPRYVTKAMLYRDGFSGTAGSKARYRALLGRLGLPGRLSPNLFCACVALEDYLQFTMNSEQ